MDLINACSSENDASLPLIPLTTVEGGQTDDWFREESQQSVRMGRIRNKMADVPEQNAF